MAYTEKERSDIMLIGAFSKLVKTTIKTLRYYDRIGLFCPTETDPITGYRSYTLEQLSDFEQIRQYRAAGLSVEQIKRILSGENQENVLQQRRQELADQEQLLRQQKKALDALTNVPSSNTYTVHLKVLPAYTICARRTRVQDASHIMTAISELLGKMKQLYPTLEFATPNYCCVTFTDTSHRETDPEIEYCEAVTTSQPDEDGFIFKTLPGGTVACVEHRGAYEGISGAYAALLRWITINGCQMTGAVRERFIHGAWDRKNESEWLTEIQVPIGD